MAKLKSKKSQKRSWGQSLVEFAIIVPIFLVVLTAVIEFGYAVYTWAALQEVARIGVRYAVTGQFDPAYCDKAATALGLTSDDNADGVVDCKVPSSVADFENKSAALQDWARMPSIRDAANKGGSSGMLFNPAASVSGDYIGFLTNPSSTFSQTYRGNPALNGYFSLSICSTRPGVAIDPNDYYFEGIHTYANRYLGVCQVNNKFMDDAGGPGDRIRVTVTYDHPLIIPFFNGIWPNLKMTTTQDAIVEKFRTSRVTGLSQGIAMLPTWSPTPLPTSTPLPPTMTSTATITNTPTATPVACNVPPNGNGLRGSYYGNTSNWTRDTWTTLVYQRLDPTVNFDWGTASPIPGVIGIDKFNVRWEGRVFPPYPGDYTFTTVSDDGIRLWIDGLMVINDWYDQGETQYYTQTLNLTCNFHTILLEYYENSGSAVAKLGWFNGMFGEMFPIATQYLFATAGFEPTSTATVTGTVTPTPTITNTVPTQTNTVYSTPTYTLTPTETLIPSDTPVLIFIPPTATGTATPIPPVQTPTNTATPTATQPPCLTPPDLGGCG